MKEENRVEKPHTYKHKAKIDEGMYVNMYSTSESSEPSFDEQGNLIINFIVNNMKEEKSKCCNKCHKVGIYMGRDELPEGKIWCIDCECHCHCFSDVKVGTGDYRYAHKKSCKYHIPDVLPPISSTDTSEEEKCNLVHYFKEEDILCVCGEKERTEISGITIKQWATTPQKQEIVPDTNKEECKHSNTGNCLGCYKPDISKEEKVQCNDCKNIYTGIGDLQCPECEGKMHEVVYNPPIPDTNTSWEDRFEVGGDIIDYEGNFMPEAEAELVPMIKDLIAQAKKEVLEELLSEIEGMKKNTKDVPSIINNLNESFAQAYCIAHNEGLDLVKDKITKLL